jgi:hypothetical protein
LEGKEAGVRGERADTSSVPRRESWLSLSLAPCSERERRAALSRLGVRSEEREWSGVGSEGLGWGVL